MTTRKLIHEDEIERIYEVSDDDGNVIGTDTEPVNPPEVIAAVDPSTVEQVKAALAKATTVAGVKTALGPLLDALAPDL